MVGTSKSHHVKMRAISASQLTFLTRYIRSHMDLDDLERMARFPPVDKYGRPTKAVLVDQAGSHGE